jgi:hypothetical protein
MIFYVLGPANVTDSFGNVGSTASIKPPIIMSMGKYMNLIISVYEVNANTVERVRDLTVTDMTVIGCTLSSIVNQTAVVDSGTKRLISVHPVAVKTESKWLPWKPPLANNTYFDPQIDGVSSAVGCVSS